MTEKRKSDNTRKVIAFIVIIAFLAAIIALSVFAGKKIVDLSKDPEVFREWISSFGYAGRLVFIGLAAIQVVLAVIPGGPVQIAAGYAFGILEGSLLCTVGIQLGSAVAFLLARYLGLKVIDLFYPREKIEELKFLQKSGKLDLIVFVCFLIPGAPKDMLTYVCGITRINFGKFMLLTTVARLPSIVISVMSGNALIMKEYSSAVIFLAVILCGSAVGTLLYNAFVSKKSGKRSSEAADESNGENL